MNGDLSNYASVSFTPESDTNTLSCANPLGVVPKLVHITTSDRSQGAMFDFACVPAFGGAAYYTTSEQYGYWTATNPSTSYRTFNLTSSTIEVQRAASATGRWLSGVTYTVHIYA